MEDDTLDIEGRLESTESAIEDVQVVDSWPVVGDDGHVVPVPPPVGLNWGTVARAFGVDLRVLQHDGSIVLAGERVPEDGFLIDAASLLAHPVEVGDRALRHAYFLGRVTMDEFAIAIPLERGGPAAAANVAIHTSGPVIGLFAAPEDAQRARDHVLRAAIASGVTVEGGPLGTEVRVGRTDVPGRVATTLAARGGAVISIAGESVSN